MWALTREGLSSKKAFLLYSIKQPQAPELLERNRQAEALLNGKTLSDLLRQFLPPSQNLLPLVTQALRAMNEAGTLSLEGLIILNNVQYTMRVKWLKDLRYLAITLKEVDRQALRPAISAFTDYLSRLLEAKAQQIDSSLAALDVRIRDLITDSIKTDIIEPATSGLSDLQVFSHSSSQPGQVSLRLLARSDL